MLDHASPVLSEIVLERREESFAQAAPRALGASGWVAGLARRPPCSVAHIATLSPPGAARSSMCGAGRLLTPVRSGGMGSRHCTGVDPGARRRRGAHLAVSWAGAAGHHRGPPPQPAPAG